MSAPQSRKPAKNIHNERTYSSGWVEGLSVYFRLIIFVITSEDSEKCMACSRWNNHFQHSHDAFSCDNQATFVCVSYV